ncbi:hypothetical protein HELRODRAFT_177787 [Helobdella robusta]|uniref:Uncharacterized protein n=1 Tax=Helobdella robusta TaxID=6412 RepID=T1FC97_HELRO|nr:hypothetical protein HELRODRAFT_177787 [Helobdella robusta]ESN97727.1 hypothetical protein HELRODRAFT_177787 [Helobdella robusta]
MVWKTFYSLKWSKKLSTRIQNFLQKSYFDVMDNFSNLIYRNIYCERKQEKERGKKYKEESMRKVSVEALNAKLTWNFSLINFDKFLSDIFCRRAANMLVRCLTFLCILAQVHSLILWQPLRKCSQKSVFLETINVGNCENLSFINSNWSVADLKGGARRTMALPVLCGGPVCIGILKTNPSIIVANEFDENVHYAWKVNENGYLVSTFDDRNLGIDIIPSEDCYPIVNHKYELISSWRNRNFIDHFHCFDPDPSNQNSLCLTSGAKIEFKPKTDNSNQNWLINEYGFLVSSATGLGVDINQQTRYRCAVEDHHYDENRPFGQFPRHVSDVFIPSPRCPIYHVKELNSFDLLQNKGYHGLIVSSVFNKNKLETVFSRSLPF